MAHNDFHQQFMSFNMLLISLYLTIFSLATQIQLSYSNFIINFVSPINSDI